MPFVLHNTQTTEIFACPLINLYKMPYYGTKSWEFEDEAREEAAEFLASRQVEAPAEWSILEVEEHQLKLFNVKLKNDPRRRLFLDAEGRSFVKLADG